MKRNKQHSNTIQQNQNDSGGKTSHVQNDSRGAPTQLLRERSNTMPRGNKRRDRPDGKRNF